MKTIQCGNGGTAMSRGNHASQKKGGGKPSGKSVEELVKEADMIASGKSTQQLFKEFDATYASSGKTIRQLFQKADRLAR